MEGFYGNQAGKNPFPSGGIVPMRSSSGWNLYQEDVYKRQPVEFTKYSDFAKAAVIMQKLSLIHI